MKKMINRLIENRENGAILIITLLVLMLLSVIGLTAINTSTMDIMISGNYRAHNVAFYASDSGINTMPHVIAETIKQDQTPVAFFPNPPFTFYGAGTAIDDGTGDNQFYREIMGFDANDDDVDMTFNLANNSNISVMINVENRGSKHLVGGGVEFASGAEGVGVGSTGGVSIVFEIDSFGNIVGKNTTQSNLGANYRHVTGIASVL